MPAVGMLERGGLAATHYTCARHEYKARARSSPLSLALAPVIFASCWVMFRRDAKESDIPFRLINLVLLCARLHDFYLGLLEKRKKKKKNGFCCFQLKNDNKGIEDWVCDTRARNSCLFFHLFKYDEFL